MRRVLVLMVLVLIGCAGPRPAPSLRGGPQLSRGDLKADAELLRHAYETLHPGLLRYNSAADIDRHFAELERALEREPSRASAFIAFSQFAATIRCGHTYANFYNQSKAVQAELFQGDNRVPFYFRWIDGRMIVTRNFSADERLVPGSEILSINGVRAARLLETLLSVARADGANEAKRVAYLEVQGNDRYEAFDIFAPLFFPQIGASLRLRVRDPGGAARSTSVAALSDAGRLQARAPEIRDGSPWQLDTPRAGVAVLTMPTWAMYNRHWEWHEYIEHAFADFAAQGVRALIVDLRANEGGDDVGNALLAHLVERDLPLPAYRRLVRYRAVPADLVPYLDTWDPSFKDWGDQAVPYDARFLELKKYDDDARGSVIAAREPRFGGKVFVLVGPTNSSATFQFADAVKRNGLATLVGRATGGNRRGINGGAFFFLKLPHSGLELDLPLIGTFPTEPQPDAGVEPDVFVASTRADIAAGRDAELAAALALASGER